MAEKLVIDASVAAKWFLKDEENWERAEKDILASFYAGDVELHAPRALHYEVCSLLAKACGTRRRDYLSRRRLMRNDGLQSGRTIFYISATIEDLAVQRAKAALEWCVDFSKTFKDMTYLNLAEQLECRFCTADDKILTGNPKTFPKERVILLSQWPLAG